MTDETSAPAGGEAIAADLPADAPEAFSSASEAAAYFSGLVDKRKQPAAESADTATADTESASQEADAGSTGERTPGEDEGTDPEAEKLPPIERPRSWSKDDDDDWNALPRARQEKIATNERAREADINRRINETAEKLKGLTAKEQQAEQARQQYEAQTRAALSILEREQLRDFPDIRTQEDIRNLSILDPVRYIQWDAHQKEMSAAHYAAQQAEGRQAQEHQTQWTSHVQAENAKAAELIPELADKVKGPALTQRAADRLTELGFKPEELNDLASGKQKLSIYDHRIQQLIFSDLKLADIQKAKTAVAKPDLPPVQRPGSSRPSGQGADSERIQALNRKPELSVKEATELYTLQNRTQRRAS